MKKIICIIMALIFVFALAACGKAPAVASDGDAYYYVSDGDARSRSQIPMSSWLL